MGTAIRKRDNQGRWQYLSDDGSWYFSSDDGAVHSDTLASARRPELPEPQPGLPPAGPGPVAATSPRNPKPPGRLRALDGLRALAIAMVVGLHASVPGFTGGGYGVTIFFVLSGFLITRILTKDRSALTGRGLSRFYTRRFLRLFPALAVVVAFCAVFAVTALSGAARHSLLVVCLTSITYTNDFYQGRGHGSAAAPYLGQTWSLGVEEQFYLLWPLILMVPLRLVRSGRTKALVALLFAAAFAVWRAHLSAQHLHAHLQYGIDGQADGLLIGCALALAESDVRAWGHRHQQLLSKLSLAALAGIFVMCVSHLNTTIPLDLGYSVTALLAAILVARLSIPTTDRAGRGVVGLFSFRPVVWIGVLSYSIYLWHPVIFDIFKDRLSVTTTIRHIEFAPVILALVIGVAACSYYFVERPFLRIKTRFEEKATDPALVGASPVGPGAVAPDPVIA